MRFVDRPPPKFRTLPTLFGLGMLLLDAELAIAIARPIQRPALAHQPTANALVLSKALGNPATIPVLVGRFATNGFSANPMVQRLTRGLTTPPLLPITATDLSPLRRIYATEADALPVNLDCVAVDDGSHACQRAFSRRASQYERSRQRHRDLKVGFFWDSGVSMRVDLGFSAVRTTLAAQSMAWDERNRLADTTNSGDLPGERLGRTAQTSRRGSKA